MTSLNAWQEMFPLPKARAAVAAVKECWDEMAASNRPDFTPTENERKLTIRLCDYLRKVGQSRGLFGFWRAEPVGEERGKEYRTDIEYLWGSEEQNKRMALVFEFKKLKTSGRANYKDGMARFVTGAYSTKEPLALMAGILEGPSNVCVPRLRKALAHHGWVKDLQIVKRPDGKVLTAPSAFFGEADFDTEHRRSIEKAPQHGTIKISHMFLEWGPCHATPSTGKTSGQVRRELEE